MLYWLLFVFPWIWFILYSFPHLITCFKPDILDNIFYLFWILILHSSFPKILPFLILFLYFVTLQTKSEEICLLECTIVLRVFVVLFLSLLFSFSPSLFFSFLENNSCFSSWSLVSQGLRLGLPNLIAWQLLNTVSRQWSPVLCQFIYIWRKICYTFRLL